MKRSDLMKLKKLNLAAQIGIAMVAGILVGALLWLTMGSDAANKFATEYIKPFGDIFVNLLKFIVVPLVLFSIMEGVISMKDITKVGKIGWKTVAYFLCTTALACIIGLIIALIKYLAEDSRALKPLAKLCDWYVTVIRGVPVTVLLLIFYYLIMVTCTDGVLVATITFGINSGAYMAELIRSGINAVDRGQMEAGLCVGMNYLQIMWHIVLPQSLPQLISAVILGACYAMGAAAPLIFTGAVIMSKVPKSLMKPAMALPNHLHTLLTQGVALENAYGTAFVLMIVVLLANTAATWFAWRRKR